MSSDIELVEAILRGMMSSDNQILQQSYQIFDSFMNKRDVLLGCFLDIIEIGKSTEMFSLIFVSIGYCITHFWSEFNEDLKMRCLETAIKCVDIIDKSIADPFADMCSAIIEVMGGQWPDFSKKLSTITDNERRTELSSRILVRIESTTNIHVLMNDAESTFNEIIECLKHPDWNCRIIAINYLGNFVKLFPGQHDMIKEHLRIIEEYALQSETLPDSTFLNLWNAISKVFSVSSIEIEEYQRLLPFVISIAERVDYLPDKRYTPLKIFIGSIDEVERPLLHRMVNLTFDIAVQYVSLTHTDPTYFFSIVDSNTSKFVYTNVYKFYKDSIIRLVSTDTPEAFTIAIHICIIILNYLPHHSYPDIPVTLEYIERVLSMNDILLKKTLCDGISLFPIYFTWSLMSSENIVPFIIPNMVSENDDLRFSSYKALEHLIRISPTPIIGLVSKLLDIVPNTTDETLYRLFNIISDSIMNESVFESDVARDIGSFFIPYLGNSDSEVMASALKCCSSLLLVHESVHDLLLDPVLNTIKSCIISELFPVQITGFKVSISLCDLFSEIITPILSSNIDALIALTALNLPVFFSIKQEALICLSSLCTDHSAFLSEVRILLKGEFDTEIITYAYCLQRIFNFLPVSDQIDCYKEFCVSLQTVKMEPVITKLVVVFAEILMNYSGEGFNEIIETAYQGCMDFIGGNLIVLNNVPPLGTDFPFGLLLAYGKLFQVVCHNQNVYIEAIFEFSKSLYEIKDSLKISSVFSLWKHFIDKSVLTQAQIEFVKGAAIAAMSESIQTDLILSASSLLTSLLEGRLIEREEVKSRISVIYNWWRRCEDNHHVMKTTIAHISLLIWQTGLKLSLSTSIYDLIAKTLSFLPPAEPSMTKRIVLLSLNGFTTDKDVNPEVCCMGIIMYAKFLLMPKMVLKARGVTKEMLNDIVNIMHYLRKLFPEPQCAINEFVGQSEYRKTVLTQFLE